MVLQLQSFDYGNVDRGHDAEYRLGMLCKSGYFPVTSPWTISRPSSGSYQLTKYAQLNPASRPVGQDKVGTKILQ
jgi:hypothetical protein